MFHMIAITSIITNLCPLVIFVSSLILMLNYVENPACGVRCNCNDYLTDYFVKRISFFDGLSFRVSYPRGPCGTLLLLLMRSSIHTYIFHSIDIYHTTFRAE